MKVRKITVCDGGNGAQTLVPIAAHNLGCPMKWGVRSIMRAIVPISQRR